MNSHRVPLSPSAAALLDELEERTRQLERANRDLAEREARLRAIFDTEPECVKLLAADGSLLAINAAGLRMIEADCVEQVLNSCIYPLVVDEHREAFRDLTERVCRGEVGTLEFQLVGLKGGRRWLETHASPLSDAGGTVTALLGITRDITERKRTELILRESADRLRLAVQGSNVGLWDWHLGTNQVTYSREWKSQLGYAEHEIRNEFSEWERLVHPDDLPSALERVHRFLARPEGAYEAEFRMRHKDGSWRWIYARGEIFRDAEGAPVRMAGCHLDLTERKLAEMQIERLNRVHAVSSAISHALVRALSPDELYEAACRTAVEKGGFLMAWIGWRRPGTERLEIVAHAGATPATLAILRTSLEAGEGDGGFSQSGRALASGAVAVCNDIEHDRRAAALGPGHRATASLPLHLGHQVVGTFNLYAGEAGSFDAAELALLSQVAADISFGLEAHRREERRKEAEVALRASEVRFRELAETIEEVFWIADPNSNRVLYVSPAFETIWGLPCRSLYATPELWSEAIHPEDRERVMEALVRGRVSGGFDEEYRIVRPDGAVRWIRDQAFPVRTADGRVERIVGMARDITDRKAAEEQLRQAQKMESVGRLAAGIAHDFNNLLTVISGVAELALAEVPEGAPLREDLAIIRDAGARAAGLTGQLLAFSRRQVLRPEVMNLNTLVAEAETLLRRVLGEDIQVVTRLDPDLEVVSVDPGQFHQVVMNLAVNSRDAMPTGGVLTVETRNVRIEEARPAHSAVPPGRYVELSFSDTGAGMDPATKQRLFEPFFTTKEPGKGTGLGLATVHGIVKQTGGEIQVRSEVGKGTTITIYLPIAEQGAERKAQLHSPSPAGGAECLVVVDDDDQVRALTKRLLQRAGYTVLTAADGPSALRLLDQFEGPVHLLLTDVVMPGMSGRQLADQVRQRRPQIRVLLMSGYMDAGRLRHGVLENGVELIGKPYSSGDLLARVRQVLES